MLRYRAAGSLALLALFCLPGCSTPKQLFLHEWHRENYALQDRELKDVQFFISTDVLARNSEPGEGAAGVIIVPMGTPGVATEVGPDWIRVSFQEGGRGVPFVTVPTKSGASPYWLATELEGQQGYRALRDLPDRVLRVEGTAYKIETGYSARLLISSKDLKELISERTHIQGRKKGED